jgi:hypothetical protein
MNLPTFPTDNLYKFMAISGLFVCIFSLVYPWTRISEIRLKILENNTKVKILHIESNELNKERDRLTKDIEALDKTIDTTEEKRTLKSLNDKDIPNIKNKLVEINLKYAAIHEKSMQVLIKCEQIQGRTEQIDALMKDFKVAWIFLIVGSLVGVNIAVTGFYRWYFFIQKPSDLLLKKQVEEIRNSLDKQN